MRLRCGRGAVPKKLGGRRIYAAWAGAYSVGSQRHQAEGFDPKEVAMFGLLVITTLTLLRIVVPFGLLLLLGTLVERQGRPAAA